MANERDNYWKNDVYRERKEHFEWCKKHANDYRRSLMFSRAIEAIHVVNAAPEGKGCLPSSIAFTHGNRALHELGIDSSFNDGLEMDSFAKELAQKYHQQTEFLPTRHLTPKKLREFTHKYPWVWAALSGYKEVGGHTIGILTWKNDVPGFDDLHWVWDTGTGYNPVIAASNMPFLSPIGFNQLFSTLNIYHGQRKEYGIVLFGFTGDMDFRIYRG